MSDVFTKHGATYVRMVGVTGRAVTETLATIEAQWRDRRPPTPPPPLPMPEDF